MWGCPSYSHSSTPNPEGMGATDLETPFIFPAIAGPTREVGTLTLFPLGWGPRVSEM